MKTKTSLATAIIVITLFFAVISFGVLTPAYAMPFYGFSPKPTVLRASFSTDYSNSSIERKHNISLAVKALNNAFIDVGGEFSFNKTVGERSEKRGYKNAKIIKDGEFTDGVGGGVCQVSTTLYNAFLLADLKITEYHAHTLSVSYVKPSFDAMVSYGYADLKAVNNTRNPIIVYAYCNGETLTVKILGEPLNYTVKSESVITEEIPVPPDKIRFNDGTFPDLKDGESRILSYGKKGLKSEGYIIKTLKGKTVSKKRFRKDVYLPVARTVVYGAHKESCDLP